MKRFEIEQSKKVDRPELFINDQWINDQWINDQWPEARIILLFAPIA
jgi:hypothetical protein